MKINDNHFYILLIILLCFFLLTTNYIWLSYDFNTPAPGVVDYLLVSNCINTKIDNIFQIYGIGINAIHQISALLNINSPYFLDLNWPRLYFIIIYFFNTIFGQTIMVDKLSNILYLTILLFSIYYIGKHYYNPKTGAIAAFIASMYPGLWGISRQFGMDLALTAMVALNTFFLIKSKDFTIMKYCILLGIFSGIGILIKGQFLFFIIAPLIYFLFKSCKQYNVNKKIVKNILIVFVLMVGISAVWWYGGVMCLLRSLLNHIILTYAKIPPSLTFMPPPYDLGPDSPKLFSLGWFFYYLLRLILYTTPFLFAAFIVFGIQFLILKKNSEFKILMLLWILVPYFIFTAISVKSERYYFPSFPAFALVTAAGLYNAKKIKLYVSFIIIFSLFQFLNLSYNPVPCFNFTFGLNKIITPWWFHTPLSNNYQEVIKNISDSIKKETLQKKACCMGLIVTDSPVANYEYQPYHGRELSKLIEYYMKTDVQNVKVINLHDFGANKYFLDNIKNLEFIIMVTDGNVYKPDIQFLKDQDAFDKEGNSLSIVRKKNIIRAFNNFKIIMIRKLLPLNKNIFLIKVALDKNLGYAGANYDDYAACEKNIPKESIALLGEDWVRSIIIEHIGVVKETQNISACTVKKKDTPKYTMEKIIINNKLDNKIIGWLLIPKGRQFPLPAVIALHQYGNDTKDGGKDELVGLQGNPEQHYAKKLAERGYVTFAIDASTFGERKGDELEENFNMLLQGNSLMGQIIKDDITSLAYLSTRPEVDNNRIACMGHSLGGIRAVYLAALEKKIQAVIISCGICSYRQLLKTRSGDVPVSAVLPGLLEFIDMQDIVSLIAPRPLLLIASEHDKSFPYSGFTEVRSLLTEKYDNLKTPENLNVMIIKNGHCLPITMHEEIFQWLDKNLGDKPKN